MKIATLNICNDMNNYLNDNSEIIHKFIKNNKIDYLCTQELNTKISDRLINKYNYKIYGKYRFSSKILKNNKYIYRYNERCGIITKNNILNYNNYSLPFIPIQINDIKKSIKKKSVFPRYISLIRFNDKNISLFDIHLDYYIKNIQIRELNKIIKLIKKEIDKDRKIIICGDFNLEKKDKIFNDFINKLETLNIKRIPVDIKTNSKKFKRKTAIDHIFISNSINVYDIRIVEMEELNNITDHKGIIIEVLL